MIGTCANQACSRTFDHLAGGKFFRFVTKAPVAPKGEGVTKVTGNLHRAEHYWLCGDCAGKFTLCYLEDAGVLLQPRPADTPKTFAQKQVTGA